MSTAQWRVLLLAFCTLCLAINAYSLFSDSVEASSALGFQVARTSNPAVVLIDGVDAGGAAEHSGLRAGDFLHIRGLSPGDRYRLLTGVYPHETIPIVVTRNGRTIALTYRAGEKPVWRWDTWVWCAASFWMLGFAFLIAWRRSDSVEARILCTLLALNPLSSGLLSGSWLGPSPLADAFTAAIGCVLTWFWPALLATYALLFGRPVSLARRMLTALAYASAAAVALYELYRLAALWTGTQAWVAQTLGPDWNFWSGGIPYLLAVTCLCAAVTSAQGAERARVAWSTASLGIFCLMQAVMFVVPPLFSSGDQGTALVVAYACVNVGSFLAPLGLTYALLNRRLLDIGFALNRVAVFSVVSLVIVGLFVLAEWGLGVWLERTNRTTGLFADAAVALVLGLSIRFVHARVEHVLDRVFFRKRHEDEQAIRRFARESAYVTDAATLISRAAAVLREHADASFVDVALDDGAGRYGGVSENDPAILALRTWHRVVDLHATTTELRGEYAFPMVARGRLIGALVLGAKRSQDSYAPDESQAVEELAHGMAGALDVLQQKDAASNNAVVSELKAMRAAIVDGFALLQARLERGEGSIP